MQQKIRRSHATTLETLHAPRYYKQNTASLTLPQTKTLPNTVKTKPTFDVKLSNRFANLQENKTKQTQREAKEPNPAKPLPPEEATRQTEEEAAAVAATASAKATTADTAAEATKAAKAAIAAAKAATQIDKATAAVEAATTAAAAARVAYFELNPEMCNANGSNKEENAIGKQYTPTKSKRQGGAPIDEDELLDYEDDDDLKGETPTLLCNTYRTEKDIQTIITIKNTKNQLRTPINNLTKLHTTMAQPHTDPTRNL
jgi:hypothetical protein